MKILNINIWLYELLNEKSVRIYLAEEGPSTGISTFF